MDPAIEAEFKKMKEKFTLMELAQSQLKQKQPTVYIKYERKLSKFAGRPENDSDPDVDDWLMDMREHILSIPSTEGKIEFINDHLIGSAKTEVRLRPAELKKTPEDILKIIEDTYKVQDTVTQLRHKFYERKQNDGETLETYSLALMKLASLIAKKEGCDMKTMDKVVTDKFIDGIMDSQIKREVRRFAFENPKLPFIEFRQRMLQWVDDTPSVKVNKVSTETPISEDLLELVKCQQNMLEHQQKQIDMLMSMTKQKPNYSPRYRGQNYRGYSNRRGHGRGYYNSGRGYYNRGKEEGPMNHPKGTPSQWGV